MLDLGALKIGISVDGADKAQKDLENVGKKTSIVGKALNGMGGIAKTAIGGITAFGGAMVGAVGGLVALENGVASTADHIDKFSQKANMSAEEFQRWDHALSLSGASADVLVRANKTLSTQMDKVVSGANSATDGFDRLGVALQNSDGSMRSNEDVMNDTIMALAQMDEGAERDALGAELLGKAYTDMIPLLNGGADAISDMKQ